MSSNNNLMEFASAVMAAASAGKLPSTKQSNDLANYLLKLPILQLEASDAGCGGKLSENGSTIMRDIREIIEAGQAVATEKNSDDILQKALYALGQVNRQQYESQGGYGQQRQQQQEGGYGQQRQQQQEGGYGQQRQQQQGSHDYISAFRIATEALLGSLDWSGQSLRQQGQSASYRDQNRDAMQVDDRDNVAERLSQAMYRLAERAQKDEEYRRGINTLFYIYDQFKVQSASSYQQTQQLSGNQLQEQLATIMGGGEMTSALKNVKTLIERFAGGKSLDGVFNAAAACAGGLFHDQEVRRAVDDWEGFIRRSFEEPRYIESNEYRQRSAELRQQWERLRERNSEAGRKWNQDVERVERESREFNQAVEQDRSVQRLRNAHLKLASHVDAISSQGQGPASFVFSDLADAILPRAFAMFKGIPLPRTEHVDEETEFVFENLKIESLELQPGRTKITNQGLPGGGAPAPASSEGQQEQKTRIEFSGVQLKLKPVSFYYKDKTGSGAAPSQINGQLEVTPPQKGLDIDLQVSVLPSQSGGKQRQQQQQTSFLRVDQATISLEGSTISMSKTNHPVSSTVFKSTLQKRLLQALQKPLEQYLRTGVEMAGSVAYDVHNRAQIFSDPSRIENAIGAYALGLTSVMDTKLRDGSLLQMQQGRPSEQQRIRGEGVPAETESFFQQMSRLREAEQRSEGWSSKAYQVPASV